MSDVLRERTSGHYRQVSMAWRNSRQDVWQVSWGRNTTIVSVQSFYKRRWSARNTCGIHFRLSRICSSQFYSCKNTDQLNAIVKNSAMWLVSPTFRQRPQKKTCLRWPDVLSPSAHVHKHLVCETNATPEWLCKACWTRQERSNTEESWTVWT